MTGRPAHLVSAKSLVPEIVVGLRVAADNADSKRRKALTPLDATYLEGVRDGYLFAANLLSNPARTAVR